LYRVLIADDLEILRYDLKRMKIWGEHSGFVIEGEAENGADALRKLRQASYDLVITDIRMPVMNGIELLKAIFEEKLSPCVVLLSDYTEFSYAREGLLYGAFDYLGKPVDSNIMEELLKRVKKHLDEKKQEIVKVKQLESMAGEAFYPAPYVDKVSALLIKGQDEAMKAVEALLDAVGEALDFDPGKALIILENATENIFAKVNAEHEWIKLYKDINDFIRFEHADKRSWQDIRDRFCESCSGLLDFLKRFVIWKIDNSPVHKACLQVLLHVEEDISVGSVAQRLFISKAYLSELFKDTAGISLSEYISMVKIERAKYLLLTTNMKAYEIAEALGYNDHEYFSKVFKQKTGISPTVYRREISQ
jgi:two-component system response regulator YesN